MESQSPYHLIPPNPSNPRRSGNRIHENEAEEGNPRRSFQKVMKEAKQIYLNPESYPLEEVEMKLEDIISQKQPGNILWPPIRQWLPELIKEPKLILNSFIGGIIVALITVPQSMAYCAMVDFPVKYGLNSCTIALIVYSIFGTSKQMSIGPLATTYFIMAQSIDSYELPAEQRMDLARTMTCLIGLWMVVMGSARMSFIENVFSEPIIFGYLQATAFLIVFEQISKICHIKFKGHIWEKFYHLFTSFDQINVVSLLIGFLVIVIFSIVHIIKKKYFPNNLFLTCMPFIIPALGTLISYSLEFPEKYQIDTAKNIPQGLPPFEIPPFSYHTLWTTWADALKVCIVSFTTSLLITKQLGKKYDYETNVTFEFLALGLANFISSFFTSLPAFGSLCRSPIIELTGAKSQFAGMITGIMVIIESLCLTGCLEQIPITIISGFVVYSCSLIFADSKQIIFWAKYFKTDFIFYLITFVLSLVVGLANGLILSIIISLLYILKNSSRPIWSFRAFESDEEKIQHFEIGKMRKNTLLLVDSLNENEKEEEKSARLHLDVNATWLVNLKRLTSFEITNNPIQIAVNSENLTADDICLCHNWKCDRKCHLVVINLIGNLTYANIKGLKEQTEFMTIDVEGRIMKISKKTIAKTTVPEGPDEKEENFIQNPLKYDQYEMKINPENELNDENCDEETQNKENENLKNKSISHEKRKLSVRAIIFECSKLNDVDYTSLNALKVMTDEFAKRDRKVWVKFSEMPYKLKKKFDLFKFYKKCLDMSSNNTMAVLYKCCADILKAQTH